MGKHLFYGEQTKKSHIDALLLAEDSDLNDLKAEISTPVDEEGCEDTAVFFPERDRLLRNTYAHGGDVVHQKFDQTAIGPRLLEIDDLNFSISGMNWKDIWLKMMSQSYALTRHSIPS